MEHVVAPYLIRTWNKEIDFSKIVMDSGWDIHAKVM
jgi:hypothetical protein